MIQLPLSNSGGHFISGLGEAVLVEAIASSVIGLLLFVWRKTATRLALRDPRLTLALVLVAVLVWVGTSAATVFSAAVHAAEWWVLLLLFLAPTGLLVCLVFMLAQGVWNAGIHGGDAEIRLGVDYPRALALVHDELSFLGTSAAKLTGQESFQGSLLRCRPDRPIRFLLMKPDDDNLTSAAQRSGKDRGEYQRLAQTSLRILKDLHENRGVQNLEVRFYDTATFDPIFRLMFVDDRLCLASFNVYGRGDGSHSPQLHLVKAVDAERSFYHAFQRYFENLWHRATVWDYSQYL